MDPASGSTAADGKYKVEGGDWDMEVSAKSNGLRTAKVTGKRLLNDAKLKVSGAYNPWVDEFTVSSEVDFKKSPIHTTGVAHYGKKTGLDLSGIYKASKFLYFGFNGFFDLKKNDLKSYNALVLLKINEAKVSLEH